MAYQRKVYYTEAQKRSAEKYQHEKVENITIRVPKGKRETIRTFAESRGESMNGFILRVIDEAMGADE